jgi:hypothetical protein
MRNENGENGESCESSSSQNHGPLHLSHTARMTALTQLLNTYRAAATSEREKGSYFEALMVCYLHHEPTYRDLYSQVWTYS